MQLEAHGISGERSTRQSRPFDRALAFFYPLLRRAALVVEGDDPLGRPRQIGHDKADTRVKLAMMSFDLGHNAARLTSALSSIGEAGVVAAHLERRASDRTLQQVGDPVLQDDVR